jgi:hypothetical protein
MGNAPDDHLWRHGMQINSQCEVRTIIEESDKKLFNGGLCRSLYGACGLGFWDGGVRVG